MMIHVPSELKPEFGKALCHAPTAYAAALALNLGIGEALFIANEWIKDPIVLEAEIAERQRLRDEVHLTKGELVTKLLNLADSGGVEPKDRVAAMKTIATIMGWEQKPQTVVNNQNVQAIRPKVIKVQTYATDADWEAAAAAQQSNLLNVATSRS